MHSTVYVHVQCTCMLDLKPCETNFLNDDMVSVSHAMPCGYTQKQTHTSSMTLVASTPDLTVELLVYVMIVQCTMYMYMQVQYILLMTIAHVHVYIFVYKQNIHSIVSFKNGNNAYMLLPYLYMVALPPLFHCQILCHSCWEPLYIHIHVQVHYNTCTNVPYWQKYWQSKNLAVDVM